MPSRRASDNPIAIACFGFVTFLPLRPLRSLPRFIACISRSTSLPALGLYLRPELLLELFFEADFEEDLREALFFEGVLRLELLREEDDDFFEADFLLEDCLLEDFFAAFFVAMVCLHMFGGRERQHSCTSMCAIYALAESASSFFATSSLSRAGFA